MPLHAQHITGGIRGGDRLDHAVVAQALDDHAGGDAVHGLGVQRVDQYTLGADQLVQNTAR